MMTTPALVLTTLLEEIALRYGEMPTPGEEVDPAELRSLLAKAMASLDETDGVMAIPQDS